MKRNKLMILMMVLCFYWIPINVYSSIQSDPVLLLQHISNNMINGLKANQATLKTKPQIVYQLAYKYVVPYADLSGMSQRVLPPVVWHHASSTQRMQFQKEFTTTLIRTYASALTAYQDQTVRFYPIRGGYQGKNTVEVRSEISSAYNAPIQVTYRLVRVHGLWKLYDLSVEGVSMLDSFRAQFSDILSQNSMNQLLQRMTAHNRR